MNPTIYKTGDIFLCQGNKLLSKLIMKITGSKYSHAALFIEIWGQPYIIDAQKNGVNPKPFEEWQKEYDYKYTVLRSIDSIDEHAFSIRAFSKVGLTAYDFATLILRHPFKVLFKKWHDKKDPYDKMVCSEYVLWVYGVERAYRMSPEDIYNWCVSNRFRNI